MTIDQINEFCKDTFIGHLEIEFLEFGKNFVTAKMPVNQRKHQPTGILHGGASLAMAETLAGAGSVLLVDETKYDVLGLQVTGNHVGTVSSGNIYARAVMLHQGQSTHVWDVKINDENEKLISVIRVTNIIREKN